MTINQWNLSADALTYRDVTYVKMYVCNIHMKDGETGCIIFSFLYHKGSGVMT